MRDHTVVFEVTPTSGEWSVPPRAFTRHTHQKRIEIRLTERAPDTLQAILAAEAELGAEPPPVHSVVAMTSREYRKRVEHEPLPWLMTVRQAAAYLDITEQRVRQLIEQGQVWAVKIGRDWILREADLEARRARLTAEGIVPEVVQSS